MQTIKIEWLSDTYDCDVCGPSYAEGARVTFPDGTVSTLPAIAHCYDNESYSSDYVYEAILYKLGYKIEAERIYE